MAVPMRFEVYPKASQRADHLNSVVTPEVTPCFELVHNSDWNDFGYFSWFSLWYIPTVGQETFIGDVKIIHTCSLDTFDVVPRCFESPLPSEFCSLGCNSNYYINLLRVLENKEQVYQLLISLRDVAFDVTIREEFENTTPYTASLLRDYSSQKALNEAKLLLEGRSEEEIFSFSYSFNVPYNVGSDIHWNVKMPYRPKRFQRIYGIIGENGIGKTSMLRKYVEDYISVELGGFNQKPLFNAINVISSVVSDNYPVLPHVNGIHYNYFPLEQIRENDDRILGTARRIADSKCLVNNVSKLEIYQQTLCTILGERAEALFGYVTLAPDSAGETRQKLILIDESLRNLLVTLSSGQLHILSLVTCLIADMHLSSLVIIDEPEVHLHPSTIVEFMLSLSDLLKKFNSYAIIATHSPLIVREIINDNVYQLYKTTDNIPLLSKVHFDTFGEDISFLYRKIFGYDENQSIFTSIVTTLASKYNEWDTEQIVEKLSSTLPMNLNARLRIFDIVSKIRDNA